MKLRVLGCSGGVALQQYTTSMLVDEDVLIDVGTGAATLELDSMAKLRHVFITHSHLDHIASLPLIVDTIFAELMAEPIHIYALPATIKALKDNIFNWVIWPDFSVLPTAEKPVMIYHEIEPGTVTELDGRRFEAIEVNHTVPTIAFRVDTGDGSKSFAFSGDTTTNDTLWPALNAHPDLNLLIVESAFSDEEFELAKLSKHYCPILLANDLRKLKHRPKVGVSHLKPNEEFTVLDQCHALMKDWDLYPLNSDDVFEL